MLVVRCHAPLIKFARMEIYCNFDEQKCSAGNNAYLMKLMVIYEARAGLQTGLLTSAHFFSSSSFFQFIFLCTLLNGFQRRLNGWLGIYGSNGNPVGADGRMLCIFPFNLNPFYLGAFWRTRKKTGAFISFEKQMKCSNEKIKTI